MYWHFNYGNNVAIAACASRQTAKAANNLTFNLELAEIVISIVIPCKNEAENLGVLLDEVDAALVDHDYEVIVVDDGSMDRTGQVIKDRMNIEGSSLRYIHHDKSSGKSAALHSGVFAAKGEIVCTLDGDCQNNPVYLPQLVDALVAAGPEAGVAAGQRLKRTDTWLKQKASRFANNLRQAILKDGTRDTGCGLKAVHTELFRTFPYFDGWHRYIPALACREGYKVVHLDVVDRERLHGQSHYGIIDRGLQGFLDLFGVWWLRKRRKVLPAVREIKP